MFGLYSSLIDTYISNTINNVVLQYIFFLFFPGFQSAILKLINIVEPLWRVREVTLGVKLLNS